MPFAVEDRAALAVDLLLQQFKGKAAMEELVAALCGPMNVAEGILGDLLTKRTDIDLAEGVQLDLLADLLGTSRQGQLDAGLRLLLRQAIALHKSRGLTDDLISLSRLSTSAGSGGVFIDELDEAPREFTAYERSDAGAFLPGALDAAAAEDVWRILNAGRAAARYFVFIWGDLAATTAAPGFRFDSTGFKFDGGSRWRLGSRGAASIAPE